ncbi:MAG: histidine phosphatase family protein [Rhizobium sp.]|jgi:probable phosphoglycerate mutase|uniref:histidine phosphatase family protein n=1 Tax=Thiobacillus sp. TaxID=924 RepID=UPI0025FF576D|nr:histidine phosphatase family protein [Thiobacillus sp.]MBW8363638.1 histidine phosphatase family protein [Rhizobium sp.]
MHPFSRPTGTHICVIRHGETGWNVEKRIQGHTDIPLNETGRAQALAMAFNAAHHRFDAIYRSDLTWALETTRVLAQREDLEVKCLPQLRERHFGLFQGLTAAEGAERYPQAYAHYVARDLDYDFGTGESLRGFAGRVSEAIDWLVRHHGGQTIDLSPHA